MNATQPTIQGHYGIWDYSVPNQSPKLVIVSIIFFTLTSLAVIFRFAWRLAHRQRGWDDLMALLAYLVLLIMTIFGFLTAEYGFGKHMADIQPTVHKALLYFYLYQIAYKLLGGFTKLTFCVLYLRIFPQKSFKTIDMIIMFIVATGSLAFAIGTILTCTPISRAWMREQPGTCTNNAAFWYSHAAFNTIMDIVIYILPIPLIRTLKLAKGQKTGLISIFGLGAFVIAASVVRMVALRSSAATTDPTWGSLDALTWTEIEGNTSVICCCLPALRVPVINFWNRVVGSRRGSKLSEKAARVNSNPRSGPRIVHGSTSASPAQPHCYHSHSDHSNGMTGTNSSRAETWYERALKSIGKETEIEETVTDSREDLTRSKTEEEADRSGSVLPAVMDQGAIYKTTDLHVSCEDAGPLPLKREETRATPWDDVQPPV